MRDSLDKTYYSKYLKCGLLLPYFKDKPPKGLPAIYYHTLSYEKDLELHNELLSLCEELNVDLEKQIIKE